MGNGPNETGKPASQDTEIEDETAQQALADPKSRAYHDGGAAGTNAGEPEIERPGEPEGPDD